MKQPTFPAKRRDGSVAVAARFAEVGPETIERLEVFIAGWLRGVSRYADLSRDLIESPYVMVEHEFTHVVFEGKPGARLWKDWMIFLTRDLAESSFGLTFLCFYDLVSGVAHPGGLTNTD